ncbi:hypothetical protein [Myroides odoratus]|uniref:hypothetical protein n=1 Tax=Myroides odoratus TaxID=256 RepID=UPI00333EF571
MKYNFYVKKIDTTQSIYFMVNTEPEQSSLEYLFFSIYNKNQIQTIIDGVLSTKDSGKEYKYQTEGDDLYIYSNSYAVQFFNLRGGKNEAELKLVHDEFISFLEDFKKFVEANS